MKISKMMVSDLMFCDIWKKRELCKLNQGLSGPLNGVKNADPSYIEKPALHPICCMSIFNKYGIIVPH